MSIKLRNTEQTTCMMKYLMLRLVIRMFVQIILYYMLQLVLPRIAITLYKNTFKTCNQLYFVLVVVKARICELLGIMQFVRTIFVLSKKSLSFEVQLFSVEEIQVCKRS